MAGRPSVVFFGSGPVAAACLAKLADWCDIEAVVTKPQPAHHKQVFPVIEVAERLGLRTVYATDRRELDAALAAESFTSRLAILIDYGIIVSQSVIDSFPLGIVNSHFSLLPEWRGADPITFSLLSGQAETGVSLMLLVPAMDEGPLLAQATYALETDTTARQLTEDLIELSDQSLQHIIPLYLDGQIQAADQLSAALSGHQTVSYSRKLTKQDGLLDFSKPASVLEREIRAFQDWPRSRAVIAGKDVVVTAATVIGTDDSSVPEGLRNATVGSCMAMEAADATRLIGIATADGILAVSRLKPAGKGEMDVRAFLAGNSLTR